MVGIRNQVKVGAKIIGAKFIACELGEKRVSIFGLVLYRNQ